MNSSSSVRPVLELVAYGNRGVPFIYRDVGTVEEFWHYLKKWCQRAGAGYPILYLAFHGSRGVVCVGDGRRTGSTITLDELAERLSGRCKGKVIHFGSCDTLDIDERHVQRFLRKTGATAATGFRSYVDWLKAAAFEALLFDVFLDGSLTTAGGRRIDRRVRREIPQLATACGFRIIVRR